MIIVQLFGIALTFPRVNGCKNYNRAARVETESSFDIRSHEILNNLGWDNLAIRGSKYSLITMHKIIHNKAQKYLLNQFHRLMDITHYNLCNNDINFQLPKPKSEYMKKRVKAWNSSDPGQ